MRAVRFHRDLYTSGAIDQAVALLAKFATLERKDEPAHFVVHVAASSPGRERKVALELGNHALTLSRR